MILAPKSSIVSIYRTVSVPRLETLKCPQDLTGRFFPFQAISLLSGLCWNLEGSVCFACLRCHRQSCFCACCIEILTERDTSKTIFLFMSDQICVQSSID